MNKPENPPAFPNSDRHGVPGMTLRDWFAGQALAGALASFAGRDTIISPAEMIASVAYEAADAMLAERAKEDK